jgi:hypothetical protein
MTSDPTNESGFIVAAGASVESALLQRGVDQEQINALGRGESSPVATNEDSAGRQRDHAQGICGSRRSNSFLTTA